ncbi:MAG: FGGY-family carbohydrate kinase [Chromatiales bacterium]
MTGPQPTRSPSPDCYLGLDLGTSGVRAIAIDGRGRQLAEAVTTLPTPRRASGGISEQDPQLWWQGVVQVLQELEERLQDYVIRALAVDGTSSSLLLSDREGEPLTPGLMYDDSRGRMLLAQIATLAPPGSPVHSASSSLAKLLWLQSQLGKREFLALHQADWILGKLGGRFGLSDENNCLKLGYDPVDRHWPAWLSRFDLPSDCLPEVHPPGTLVGRLSDQASLQTRMPGCIRLVTGTTDSNAATLAAGAQKSGDAVTSLGSTLVLKILSARPVVAPQYGVYSHRLGDQWLVGGASNSGGAVTAAYFTPRQMARLTKEMHPDRATGLDYYPLLRPGERFPVNDPEFPPRLTPRVPQDSEFFQGILEGIARIEKKGYELLHQLGAPKPSRVISIGGGAVNEPWRQMREQLLGVPVSRAEHTQAAYGTALLALQGCG